MAPGPARRVESKHAQAHQLSEGRMTRAIRQCLRRLCRDQRGTAAVEFGIVAPVFFATLLGIVDVGRYMWTLNTMQYAVDQAIRTGVVQQLAPEDVEQQVKD